MGHISYFDEDYFDDLSVGRRTALAVPNLLEKVMSSIRNPSRLGFHMGNWFTRGTASSELEDVKPGCGTAACIAGHIASIIAAVPAIGANGIEYCGRCNHSLFSEPQSIDLFAALIWACSYPNSADMVLFCRGIGRTNMTDLLLLMAGYTEQAAYEGVEGVMVPEATSDDVEHFLKMASGLYGLDGKLLRAPNSFVSLREHYEKHRNLWEGPLPDYREKG